MERTRDKDARREVISLRHVWAGYDHQAVLKDVNLSVKALDFIGIVGPNGGGKTTLFKVLLGLIAPIRGEVRIMGEPVEKGRLSSCRRSFEVSVTLSFGHVGGCLHRGCMV